MAPKPTTGLCNPLFYTGDSSLPDKSRPPGPPEVVSANQPLSPTATPKRLLLLGLRKEIPVHLEARSPAGNDFNNAGGGERTGMNLYFQSFSQLHFETFQILIASSQEKVWDGLSLEQRATGLQEERVSPQS